MKFGEFRRLLIGMSELVTDEMRVTCGGLPVKSLSISHSFRTPMRIEINLEEAGPTLAELMQIERVEK
jgi:hypothetical protein